MTATPSTAGDRTINRSDSRRLILGAFYGVAAFFGATQVLTTNTFVTFATSLLLALLAAGWCVTDARKRGQPILSVVQMLMFFTWPIAVPIYLIVSRKWRGLGLVLLHAIGLYVVTATAFSITWYCLDRLSP